MSDISVQIECAAIRTIYRKGMQQTTQETVNEIAKVLITGVFEVAVKMHNLLEPAIQKAYDQGYSQGYAHAMEEDNK